MSKLKIEGTASQHRSVAGAAIPIGTVFDGVLKCGILYPTSGAHLRYLRAEACIVALEGYFSVVALTNMVVIEDYLELDAILKVGPKKEES